MVCFSQLSRFPSGIRFLHFQLKGDCFVYFPFQPRFFSKPNLTVRVNFFDCLPLSLPEATRVTFMIYLVSFGFALIFHSIIPSLHTTRFFTHS